jgi:hypothetical protein
MAPRDRRRCQGGPEKSELPEGSRMGFMGAGLPEDLWIGHPAQDWNLND